MYLAECLGMMPGCAGAFERAECMSVVSALSDLQEKLGPAMGMPTLNERKMAFEQLASSTIPEFLMYQERFVRGACYFGDKVRVRCWARTRRTHGSIGR